MSLSTQSARSGLRRRLTVCVAGVAAVSVPLVGCSPSGDDQGAGDGPVTITLSMHQENVEENDPATWAIVEAFNAANPDIVVEVEGQPVEQHLQNMTIAAQSNTLPEIFWIYDANARDMLEAGNIMDLGPMLEETGTLEQFPSSMLTAYNNGEAQYGVPYEALITGFYYNKEIFAQHGLEVPVTFEDLIGVCETLSAAGVTPIAKGANQSAFSVWAFLGMLSRFGYEDVYQDILDGKASYDNPDFVKFYEHIAEMREAGCFPSNVSTQTFAQATDSFVSGDAAMFDSGVWSASAVDASELAGKVGFWAGPTFSDGVGDQQLIINVPSAPLVVSAAVEEDEARYAAVQEFLAFYYSEEGQQLYVDNGKPPVTSLEPEVDESTSPTFAAVLEATTAEGWSSPAAQPDLVVPTAVASAMYDSIYGVIQGVFGPEEAVALVQTAIETEQ